MQREVLTKAEDVFKLEGRAAEVVLESTRAEVSSRRQSLAQLRQQAAGASARLAYLLGVPPDAELVPVDRTLAPIDLADPTPPPEVLVAQVMSHGPGVQELEAMLASIDRGIAQSESLMRFLPTLKVNVIEGAFGAGPNSSLDWSNRLDVCVSARWNLTDLLTAQGRRALADSKRQQAALGLEDLRGGLASRVKEAREASLEGREQVRQLRAQVEHADKAYRLSRDRFLDKPVNYFTEMLQSIRALEQAHMQYLSAVAAYNKAQVRLMVLLGAGKTGCQPVPPSPDGSQPVLRTRG
jgi:outer membrane protein TolC